MPAISSRTTRTLITIGAGVVASATLALATTGTLAGFTATITNSNNTTATGVLTMQETNSAGTVTCTSTDGANNSINSNAATCSTINKYGGSLTMVPGTPVTTTVTIKNTGTVPAAAFTLQPGVCNQQLNGAVNGSATDLCTKISLTVTATAGTTTSTVVNALPLSGINGLPYTLPAPVAPGAAVSFTFVATLVSTAGNTYQGLGVTQPLVWQFSS